MTSVPAPFSPAQIAALNTWQRTLGVPALTCDECDGLLTPATDGLECRRLGCGHSRLAAVPAVCLTPRAAVHG